MLDRPRRLLPYLLRYQRQISFGLLATLLTTAISLVAPWVLKHALDDLTQGVTAAKLRLYALLLVAVAVAGGIFRFLMRRTIINASREIEYDLRNDFFAALQRFPLSYFHAHRTGDLMSRAINDLGAVRTMIGPVIMYTANTVPLLIVATILMLSIDARLALVALIPLPFVSIAVKYFGSAIHKRFEQIQAKLADLSAVAQENLSAVRVIRAYCQEDREIERFERANQEYVDRNRVLVQLQGAFFPSMSLLLGFGALLVLWMGSREVIRGRITVGEFVAFNAYLTMLAWPMIAFGWVTNMLQRGLASWKRMLEVMDAAPPVDRRNSTPRSGRADAIRGEIEFRDLVFSYNGHKVIDHVSARFEAGQTVALVGATGSGKSTLVNLVARLYEPPPGTVFVDGIDVRDMSLATLRGAIGFVPQEAFLFSATVAENIAFGAERGGLEQTAELAAIERAAAIARLDKDVADFPDGYRTPVGERGITLSGGQKQRTALARALMIDPRILILDDALSAVDTYTEEEILGRLRGFMRGRTALIVSHRVSTVRQADQILVLDDGRIVEHGRHDELVELDGMYAALYRKQLLEEELAAS